MRLFGAILRGNQPRLKALPSDDEEDDDSGDDESTTAPQTEEPSTPAPTSSSVWSNWGKSPPQEEPPAAVRVEHDSDDDSATTISAEVEPVPDPLSDLEAGKETYMFMRESLSLGVVLSTISLSILMTSMQSLFEVHRDDDPDKVVMDPRQASNELAEQEQQVSNFWSTFYGDASDKIEKLAEPEQQVPIFWSTFYDDASDKIEKFRTGAIEKVVALQPDFLTAPCNWSGEQQLQDENEAEDAFVLADGDEKFWEPTRFATVAKTEEDIDTAKVQEDNDVFWKQVLMENGIAPMSTRRRFMSKLRNLFHRSSKDDKDLQDHDMVLPPINCGYVEDEQDGPEQNQRNRTPAWLLPRIKFNAGLDRDDLSVLTETQRSIAEAQARMVVNEEKKMLYSREAKILKRRDAYMDKLTEMELQSEEHQVNERKKAIYERTIRQYQEKLRETEEELAECVSALRSLQSTCRIGVNVEKPNE